MNTFESLSQFNTYKVSANDDNTSYTFGLNSDIYDGAPDILWEDICFIKDIDALYFNGQYYGKSLVSDISINIEDNNINVLYKDVIISSNKLPNIINSKIEDNNIFVNSGDVNFKYTLRYVDKNNLPLNQFKEITYLSENNIYDKFISYNDICNNIGVFDKEDNLLHVINISEDILSYKKNHQYTFALISDIHLWANREDPSEGQGYYYGDDTAYDDLLNALTLFNNDNDIEFVCTCGDLSTNGTQLHLASFKNMIDTYLPNKDIYAIYGNHESYGDAIGNGSLQEINEITNQYLGHDFYYSYEKDNDVYIFLGIKCTDYTNIFFLEELQWLYETLETNRNKRCFLFEHVRPYDTCGNAYGIYPWDIWNGEQCKLIEDLLHHYKNVIFFHGHSHLKFELQDKLNIANIDTAYGMYSIHVPSLAVPRDGQFLNNNTNLITLYAKSLGYIIDVFENGILLKGYEFSENKQLPIARYWLPTNLVNIEEHTFVDNHNILSGANNPPMTYEWHAYYGVHPLDLIYFMPTESMTYNEETDEFILCGQNNEISKYEFQSINKTTFKIKQLNDNTTDFAICIEDNFGIILNINDGKIYHQNEILGEIELNKIYTILFNKLSKNVINIKLYNEYNEELMSSDIHCYALQSMSYISTNCNIDSGLCIYEIKINI